MIKVSLNRGKLNEFASILSVIGECDSKIDLMNLFREDVELEFFSFKFSECNMTFFDNETKEEVINIECY